MFRAHCLAVFALTLTLVACGGGGGGDGINLSPTPRRGTAEGQWQGSNFNINGGGQRSIGGVVLNDGSYWFLYSIVGNADVVGGLIQGSSTSSAGNFISSDGASYSFDNAGSVSDFSVSGTYAGQSSLGGTLNFTPSGSATFTSAYDGNYDLARNLATVAGTYSGTGAFAPRAPNTGAQSFATTFTVANDGAISGTYAGCPFSATLTARASGNVYDMAFNSLLPCSVFSLAGVAVYQSNSLRLGLRSADRSTGVAVVASK